MGEEHTPCIKDDKFWESRGISEEVRNARPYIGWYDRPSTDSASVEALVNKHYPKPTFTGGQQRAWTGLPGDAPRQARDHGREVSLPRRGRAPKELRYEKGQAARPAPEG